MANASAADSILESLEIGSMIAMVMFGMSTIQVYIYLSDCRSDPRWLKIFVVCIWLLELAHTFLSGYSIIVSTIIHDGKSMDASDLYRLNTFSGLVAAIISSCVQAWFAYRLLKLSGKTIFPRFCMVLSAVRFALFYALAIYEIVATNTSRIWKWLLFIPAVLACAGDLLVAGGLVWCLWVRYQERIFRRTIIDKILVWCLETNLLTCLSTLLAFLFYEINNSIKANYIWVPLSLVNCRLYSMCFFASLIAKKRLENERRVYYIDSELATGDSSDRNIKTNFFGTARGT